MLVFMSNRQVPYAGVTGTTQYHLDHNSITCITSQLIMHNTHYAHRKAQGTNPKTASASHRHEIIII